LVPRLEAAGWPQIVVNSAGAGRWLYTEDTSPAEAAAMIGAPYLAAFYVTRLCLPAMLRRGAGHIVNINSPVARGGWPGAAGYTAARYALQGFTNALRYDLHGTGVRVVSVVPGRVSSEYFDRNPGVEARLPGVGRLLGTVTPDQVAQAVVSGIEHNRREVILPFLLRVFFVLNVFAPRLVEWAVLRTGARHPKARRR
jgi:short-subunit dehydrogenase